MAQAGCGCQNWTGTSFLQGVQILDLISWLDPWKTMVYGQSMDCQAGLGEETSQEQEY